MLKIPPGPAVHGKLLPKDSPQPLPGLKKPTWILRGILPQGKTRIFIYNRCVASKPQCPPPTLGAPPSPRPFTWTGDTFRYYFKNYDIH